MSAVKVTNAATLYEMGQVELANEIKISKQQVSDIQTEISEHLSDIQELRRDQHIAQCNLGFAIDAYTARFK